MDVLHELGDSLRPGQPDYERWLEQLPSAPARCAQPLCVLFPRDAADIQAAISWARLHGQRVTVVGGGHSGHCVWDSALAIDLRRHFATVQLLGDPPRRLVAGGGASMGQICSTAAAGGVMCALGTAPTVGAGLLLQGGVGHLSRWRGLAVDCIETVECVTADGVARTVTHELDAELFWALRGAAPNIAIVTQVTLRTFDLAAVWCSQLDCAHDDDAATGIETWGPSLLQAYSEVATSCAPHHTADACLHWALGSAGTLQLHVCVSVYEWEAVDTGAELTAISSARQGSRGLHSCMLDALRSASRAAGTSVVESPPTRHDSPSELFAFEKYLLLDPYTGLDATTPGTLTFWVRCPLLRAPMTAAAAAALCAAVRSAPNASCYVNLQHCGGAASQTSLSRGCFGTRDWEWSAVVTGVYIDPQDAAVVRAWVNATVHDLLPHASGTYCVDLGPDDSALAALAFGEDDRQRLRATKAAYDPAGLLTLALPIVE